jgi:hypothetical protein
MVTDTTKLGSRTMRPPAPSYVPGPIPLHRLLRAVLFNPLQIWSREHFEEPLVVSRTPLGTRVVVSDPEAIKWILVDNSSNYVRDSLQQRILLRTTGRSLFSSEGADWRLLRKAFAPFFSRRALGAFLPGMIAAADKLVQRLEVCGGEEIELDREMAAAAVDALSRTLLPTGSVNPNRISPQACGALPMRPVPSGSAISSICQHGFPESAGLPDGKRSARSAKGRGASWQLQRNRQSLEILFLQ